ncbi:Uncharacterised protein [Chlamydia trachomatis]|nr:Uncharacterised protein [Chlamydia trachomatis]
MTEFIHPVRVLQETHVKHMISINRDSSFEAERFNCDLKRTITLPRNDIADMTRQVMDGHIRRVNHFICNATNGSKHATFGFNAVQDCFLPLQRVRATVGLVAFHQSAFVCLEEDNPVGNTHISHLVQRLRQIGKECA